MRHISLSTTLVACIIAFTADSTPVLAAFCSPFMPHVRTVGNKAGDSSCDDATLQAAIDNTVCPNTTIYVTDEQAYTAQALTIQDKSLSIVGSSATSCANVGSTGGSGTPPTAPLITISGAGNGGHSVITIGGTSNVTLQYVEITGGSGDANSHGGGINFNGNGSLTIDTTTIDSNQAGFGGGIEVNGGANNATLALGIYSIIESNTASGNGGGINIEGHTNLIAVHPFTLIGFNHAANGKGGGIAVVGPARADIGSPGYDNLAVVYGNDAKLGGGMSAEAVDAGNDATIELYTADPGQPPGIVGNFAAQVGGGIYLKPILVFGGGVASATLCAHAFHIDDNAAPDGAALYADSDTSTLASGVIGGILSLTPTCAAATAGEVACTAGAACASLDGNEAVDGSNNPTAGATVSVQDNGFVTANRLRWRNNHGAHAIHTISSTTKINTCLIADNAYTAEAMLYEDNGDGGLANIFNCTFVNNAHTSGSIVRTAVNATLRYDIFDQPAMSTVSTIGAPAIFADDVLAADPTGLPLQANIVQGEPMFVDASNADIAKRDYHQTAVVQSGVVTASLGIDFAPPLTGDDRDLDGKPYDQDVSQVPDFTGVRDLGCFEAQPITDRVFADALGDAIAIVY